jgi:hypothetical protein
MEVGTGWVPLLNVDTLQKLCMLTRLTKLALLLFEVLGQHLLSELTLANSSLPGLFLLRLQQMNVLVSTH